MVETSADFKDQSRQAVTLHQQGRLAEAERIYLEIIRKNPAIVGPRYMLGVLRLQQGDAAQAVELMAPSARVNPDDIATQMNFAMALRAAGRLDEALERFQHAAALEPGLPEAHYNSGVVQAEMGRFENAIESYEKALALRPGMVLARGNLGIVLAGVGRPEEALAQYAQVLAAQPMDSSTLYNRGLAYQASGKPDAALADFEAAAAAAPDFADPLYQSAITLSRLGRFADALPAFDAALALRPEDAEIHSNRSVALWNLGRTQEALASAERALEIDPELASAWNNRGVLLRRLNRPADAVASFTRAIEYQPGYSEALNNRAYAAWTDQELYRPAMADLTAAMKADPEYPYLAGELLHLKMQGADWQDYETLKAEIDAGVRAGKRAIRPFAYQAVSASPADLRACAEIFAADQFAAVPLPAPAVREAGAKLRIGYVSADFREQATAYLMAGLYEHHDRDRFEIIAFDNGGSDKSPMRARLQKAFAKFVDIRALNDEQAADAVRAGKIDILVNLNGYFGKPRMGVFARRPAPVQVSYLGFPGTLGARYIDYILADAIVIPLGEERFYSEGVVRLPGSYQVNDNKRAIGGDTNRTAHGLPEDAFVFCNFNQGYKLTPAIFDVWARILNATPGSVLWLLDSHHADFRENLRRQAEARGIARARLIFAPAVDLARHLARLKLADLFLDTLPYNAHTTASDALWAGVPLLTCRGTTFAGRVAASLLSAAGVPELIAETLPDYEKQAIMLAADRGALNALRGKLAAGRNTRALFDTARTTALIEAAYRGMWERRGQAPSGFTVGE